MQKQGDTAANSRAAEQRAPREQELRHAPETQKVIWMDIRKNFLDDQGNLSKSMMPDYLHPRKFKGYSVWGESLLPYFEKYGK